MASVLFVCLHNAGRSQMSQALFERVANGRHTALSAGTTPAEHVHPEVIEVMRELGVDLSGREPQLLTQALAEGADLVVTMGCGDACPVIPGKRYIDWDLADPKGRPLPEVRATRDEIDRRIASLIGDLDGQRHMSPQDVAIWQIAIDDPRADDVRHLLEHHLSFTRDVVPPEDNYTLAADGLVDPAVTFFSIRAAGELLGVAALKRLDSEHAEIKSMHTAQTARGQGVGRTMLNHLLAVARERGYREVSLETGTAPVFAPARHLYESAGFIPCDPFASYASSPHSTCMTLPLASAAGTPESTYP